MALDTQQAERIARAYVEMQTDAERYVRQVLRADPTPQQVEALHAISPRGAHVSIRSGHGIGKTCLLSWIVLWMVDTHPDCRVPCTAPTGHQLYDLLWPEIYTWRNRMEPSMRDRIIINNERVCIRGAEKSRFAVPRTARPETPEALQGFHATNLMYVVDEASGVHEKIYEVAEGALSTAGSRVIMTGNPTRTDGYFYKSHHKDREYWTALHFSCLNSRMVDSAYPISMAKRYGIDSDVYRVRVKGDFPKAGSNILIPLDLVEHAFARNTEGSGRRKAGLDIARFGDDSSALVIRHGSRITHIEKWSGNDLVESSGRALARFNEGLFDEIAVDEIGIGSGVVDILKHAEKFPVVGVNVGRAAKSETYARLRDELWFSCREWLRKEENAACIPGEGSEETDQLLAEITGTTYHFTMTGKYQVESKKEMKERLGFSPDIADALNMTFADYSAMPDADDWADM